MNCHLTTDIAQAVSFIAAGRIVAFPTGTSYGLAADATQGYALQRLRILKGRPQDQTFTVMLKSSLWSEYLQLTSVESDFLQRVKKQPLTLLVKPQPSLDHLADDGLVGLRLIDHSVMEQFCQAVSVPLTATSANRTGQPPCFSPACVQSIFPGIIPDDQLEESNPRGASGTTYNLSLACVLDGGVLPQCPPTTIFRLTGPDSFTITRPGAISEEDLAIIITSNSTQ